MTAKQREAAAIAEVMAQLEEAELPPAGASGDPQHLALVREFTEVLGALPYELARVHPNPAIRTKVLTAVAGRSLPRNPSANRAPRTVLPKAMAPARSGLAWHWVYPLAALFACCLLGLGFLAGRLHEQAATLKEFERQQAQQAAQIAAMKQERAEFVRLQSRWQMITTVARQVYPLRPASPSLPGNPGGTIYVCGAHQQWLLYVRGLPPPPADRQYQFWFLTQSGAVSGGTVEVAPGATAQLEAPSMPVGTHGFALTLEPRGDHPRPAGPRILVAEHGISL